MEIRRIVPNIPSNSLEDSKVFYGEFLGLKLVMDMEWILTFASRSNPLAQISIIATENERPSKPEITITMEVSDVDAMYKTAKEKKYLITYPLKQEEWGVTRFFVEDPNGVTLNLMSHIAKEE